MFSVKLMIEVEVKGDEYIQIAYHTQGNTNINSTFLVKDRVKGDGSIQICLPYLRKY